MVFGTWHCLGLPKSNRPERGDSLERKGKVTKDSSAGHVLQHVDEPCTESQGLTPEKNC